MLCCAVIVGYVVMFECCCFCADASVKTLLEENEKALKLLRSEILQTEVRVLYELLYILNNSSKGNKTFKGLKQVRTVDESLQDVVGNEPVFQDSACVTQKSQRGRTNSLSDVCVCVCVCGIGMFHVLSHLPQVEQCINRLKSMKLDVALQELTELCPNRIQR